MSFQCGFACTIRFCHAGIQEKLGIMNNGEVYAVFSYEAQQSDELTFEVNDQLTILRKGDDSEREWWWAKLKDSGKEGYVPRNLLGVSDILLGDFLPTNSVFGSSFFFLLSLHSSTRIPLTEMTS